ncbi:MAG: deoxyribodipyrimidine photo-lyase [Flavobacteriales bacterium]|nr:deoxyribodipyrimidine photo-lyase [Flavobacteriales bacterium]MBK6944225.1 deoxyribodipyrimidine photo-lyase [Flavobacteriales bacterium]MBK7240425.1 deoxyribodipyrimidine photo-lyase [Flavobacteriales bacterium]MBK7295279.1 deoxyribodipyrimidine photo-lyase [Flavobacteriales bacterium]MBK9533892.1 deoxyribodipyrimidine photo-lyase [Flavobacteriales bacterium]
MSRERPMNIFWFRRDLRLNDNHGLFRALRDGGNVQPLFIFDTNILEKLEDRNDRRLSFLYDNVCSLDDQLRAHGASLMMLHGDPLQVFKKLIQDHAIAGVYANHDHEPYALTRDRNINDLFIANGHVFRTYKDQTIFERDEVLKEDGTPYTVFTPYAKRWRARMAIDGVASYNSEGELGGLLKDSRNERITLKQLGFEYAPYEVAPLEPAPALLKAYADDRNTPSIAGTTRIGVHLRFGTVSVRGMVRLARANSETWLNELIWREFFMQILWHFPHVERNAFRKAYDAIAWRDDEKGFAAWCEGRTGYPLVDAGMRELRATGFMHNRVRMVVASFLCKHLLIDWRLGEAWFARWLMDYELSSNNGNWQWAAGSGCDAAPYFRVFNPTLQLERFDPKMKYVLKWAPEYGELKLPEQIVEHNAARERAIAVYKTALNKV